jgi:hypothetical protein
MRNVAQSGSVKIRKGGDYKCSGMVWYHGHRHGSKWCEIKTSRDREEERRMKGVSGIAGFFILTNLGPSVQLSVRSIQVGVFRS